MDGFMVYAISQFEVLANRANSNREWEWSIAYRNPWRYCFFLYHIRYQIEIFKVFYPQLPLRVVKESVFRHKSGQSSKPREDMIILTLDINYQPLPVNGFAPSNIWADLSRACPSDFDIMDITLASASMGELISRLSSCTWGFFFKY